MLRLAPSEYGIYGAPIVQRQIPNGTCTARRPQEAIKMIHSATEIAGKIFPNAA